MHDTYNTAKLSIPCLSVTYKHEGVKCLINTGLETWIKMIRFLIVKRR